MMNNTTFGDQQTGTATGTGTGIGSYESGRPEAQQHTEGMVARGIEQQTAKLPSDLFLWAAFGAIGVSAFLEFSGNTEKSRFVGQWVAPFLLLGVYNKIVKVAGSDREH
jgi:hypothetical protein